MNTLLTLFCYRKVCVLEQWPSSFFISSFKWCVSKTQSCKFLFVLLDFQTQSPACRGRYPGGYTGQLKKWLGGNVSLQAPCKEGKAERQQHKTFSLEKLEYLTAAGPNTKVRNKINKGGSWHQWSPSARACCSDDRQGELMRYDVVCCTVSPCCSVMMVTMRFPCSPGPGLFALFFTTDATSNEMVSWSLSS